VFASAARRGGGKRKTRPIHSRLYIRRKGKERQDVRKPNSREEKSGRSSSIPPTYRGEEKGGEKDK